MDKLSHTLWSRGRNSLSIPKLQRCNHWSLGMDMYFRPIRYWTDDYLSMLRIKLDHVSKRDIRYEITKNLRRISERHFTPTRKIVALLQSNFTLFLADECSLHQSGAIMDAVASQNTGLSIVYSTVYSGVDTRKYQGSTSLPFVRGIRRWPVNCPHRGPVTRKMLLLVNLIMWLTRNPHPFLDSFS